MSRKNCLEDYIRNQQDGVAKGYRLVKLKDLEWLSARMDKLERCEKQVAKMRSILS